VDIEKEIVAAIGAHGAWKLRLDTAINSGLSELSPSIAGRDDQCDFGKWLRAVSDLQVKNSAGYRKCLELHREFHSQAAKVLTLALAGKKAEAKQSMSIGGPFASTSASLTTAMMSWRQNPR
jgi:hypothetical protein